MRTAPVGLGGDSYVMYAKSQSALTHMNRDASEACLIWSAAIAHAVDTGELDLRHALWALAEYNAVFIGDEPSPDVENTPEGRSLFHQSRADQWTARIDEAEAPSGARHRDQRMGRRRVPGCVVRDRAHGRRRSPGAAYGVSAIPLEWQRVIHGWPGWRVGELIERAVVAARPGRSVKEWPLAEYLDYEEWGQLDTCVRHPHDPGVYLGAIGSLDRMPADVDAVVSFCHVGRSQVPADRIAPENHIRVWLVDSDDVADNQHVDFVLTEAADLVARLRAEGRVVLLHCVQPHSRTPSVGALYAARDKRIPVAEAVDQIVASLPMAYPNHSFGQAIQRIVTKEAVYE